MSTAETFPERVTYPPRSQMTEPYAEYLKKRLQEGCRNAALLHREIKAQGYRGGSATVRRLMRSWKQQLPVRYQRLEALPDFDAPAPRQAVWWLLKSEELEPNQKEYARELQRLSSEISSGLKLVKEFHSLLVGKQVDRFDQWRLSVEQSGLLAIKSSVKPGAMAGAPAESATPSSLPTNGICPIGNSQSFEPK